MVNLRLKQTNRIILKEPRLIMLDKDGTIIDAHHYWVSMITKRSEKIFYEWLSDKKEAIDDLSSIMGVDLSCSKLKPQGPVGIKPRSFIIDIVSQRLREKWNCEKTHAQIEDLFTSIDKETSENLRPLLRLLPQVKSFLTTCCEKKIKLAIVTTDITPRAVAAMNALGIEQLFDHILGADLVQRTKPHSDLAQLALNLSSESKEHAVVVGDHAVDIEMGINAGLPCNIGVLTGISSRNDFRQVDCHVIDSFNDIVIT